MDIYERYGRKTEMLEEALEMGASLRNLIILLKEGVLQLDEVDVVDGTVSVRRKVE